MKSAPILARALSVTVPALGGRRCAGAAAGRENRGLKRVCARQAPTTAPAGQNTCSAVVLFELECFYRTGGESDSLGLLVRPSESPAAQRPSPARYVPPPSKTDNATTAAPPLAPRALIPPLSATLTTTNIRPSSSFHSIKFRPPGLPSAGDRPTQARSGFLPTAIPQFWLPPISRRSFSNWVIQASNAASVLTSSGRRSGLRSVRR